MLPRSLNELYERLRDFYVVHDNGGIVGVCALQPLWEDIAEIRSLIIAEPARRKGLGKQLVKKCMSESKKIGVTRVFALTYIPEFFLKMGFKEVDKSALPHKIWSDCLKCHKFPECDEFAVIKTL